MRKLTSFDELRKVISIGEIAHLCDVGYTASHNWLTDEQFPAATFFVIQTELRRRGCTAPRRWWKFLERPPGPIQRRTRSVAA